MDETDGVDEALDGGAGGALSAELLRTAAALDPRRVRITICIS